MADNTGADASVLHRREVFYVGGEYVPDSNGGHTLQGQMYVERLLPSETPSREFPIVFIHGATRSGTDWLTKPDGQPGWASYFLSRGFECYLVDLPFRGRSPWHPGSSSSSNLIDYPAEAIQAIFTACRDFGTWPQAKLHTQWPGAGVRGDPVFDQFYASGLPIVGDTVLQESASQAACAALLDRIGRPTILVGHSAGGPVPWLTADVRPGLVKMIVALEPAGPPFYKVGIKSGPAAPWGITNVPITYDPPVKDPAKELAKMTVKGLEPGLMDCTLQAEESPRRLVNLVGTRVLVVTAPASYHAQYDWATVRYLRQAGVADVEHLRLEERGILGNGHMMFMEKNSDEVAEEIMRWIDGYKRTE